MDRNERTEDAENALLYVQQSIKSTIWTSLPCIIKSFNAAKMTVEAQPCMQGRVRSPGGDWQWINLPLLTDVPVLFPSGGGFTLTFPIAAGDECLVMFSARCIDSWWISGGVNNRLSDLRALDLSDGFAFVGPRSQPHVISGIKTDGVELRSDSGLTSVNITNGVITLTAPSLVKIVAPTLEVDGDVVINGGLTMNAQPGDSAAIVGNVNITGTLTNNGKNVGSTHTHSGVTTGSGNTGAPT